MVGKCALFDIETELNHSHIIPKFAFDYLKETGGRYLRTYDQPNKRLQDGPKRYLLSRRAELEFSKRERWFANNIFIPYMKDDEKYFVYNENFAFFIISVLWRVLVDQLKHPDIASDPRFQFLMEVQNEWKKFLSEAVYPRNYDDLNIFLISRISSHCKFLPC